ncbi:MAG: phenylalanine--tRNA ligase subunit beta [Candidatus Methanomethylophilus sp.]|nr:phenylalanine--tRNA ligase subunit beta [Methanomethylophilus sp.]MDD3233341.1 phenylalanine--tRNA ligase subunit beta [Methanomethylophilus sp.]MDD4222173.1 phenylalanine--tRNA ligase subunit beta [Methanomethylophilus sp.]MDD4668332.1 phenylalanine--tRNA ligase subunit beta [Methanomethylophilus sp.]
MGKDVSQEEILKQIPLIGSDIGDNVAGTDAMSVEFFPNRPDMYSVEGIARGMRAFLGIKPGLQTYTVGDSDITAVVDPSVREVRPCFLCAAVFNVRINDEALRSMMELQEKLHITVGRKRSKVAIGIHDLDKVTPPFTYHAVDPHSIRFVPLAKTEEMDLAEILEKHEKGKAYAHLLDGYTKYPIITDATNRVLSFPPIINGALTAVTTQTANLFIDVTGFDWKAVETCLNVVVTSLAERGGQICRVNMQGIDISDPPRLDPVRRTVSLSDCNRFIGIPLAGEQAVTALRRMGMDGSCEGDKLTAVIPAYRADIMHDVDIYEDVSIGYGFEKYGRRDRPLDQTFGALLPETAFGENVKDILVGLGYTELTTLTLSNQREEFEISGLPAVETVNVTNPITEDHTCLRAYLMPSLMRILRHNKHRDLPQQIFEVGFVVRDQKTVLHLCALKAASKTPFTEAKSFTESVLRELGTDYAFQSCNYPTFIPGRGALITVGGQQLGFFGEVAPKVITDFEMTHPILMLELDLSSLIAARTGKLI